MNRVISQEPLSSSQQALIRHVLSIYPPLFAHLSSVERAKLVEFPFQILITEGSGSVPMAACEERPRGGGSIAIPLAKLQEDILIHELAHLFFPFHQVALAEGVATCFQIALATSLSWPVAGEDRSSLMKLVKAHWIPLATLASRQDYFFSAKAYREERIQAYLEWATWVKAGMLAMGGSAFFQFLISLDGMWLWSRLAEPLGIRLSALDDALQKEMTNGWESLAIAIRKSGSTT